MPGFVRILGFCALAFAGCKSDTSYTEVADNPAYLHASVKTLSDVIVHDIFSPPVASRIYAYPSIAAYEVMAAGDSLYPSLTGHLHEFEFVPQPEEGKVYSLPVAALHAYLQTGKALIFSEQKIDAFQDTLYRNLRNRGIPKRIFERSIAYGQEVSDAILHWANEDAYKETRTMPKYSIPEDPSLWQPTPPNYMEGIEPHWDKIRTFVIDSAQQFVPPPPTEFSTDPGSKFYVEAMEVRDAVSNSTAEMEEIARFWDCNPYVSHQQGHVMFATKKITPGGHWIGITGQACRVAEVGFTESARAYALVSITLADGFISCWDEKYRSNLVRPETYINRVIDDDWDPVLQTPPFPEHTSGHSVISSAAGEMLTALLGEPFHFADSVEVEYGLPVRSFNSFREAYEEAAISRLYGGIHYMPAIEYGIEQGRKIGRHIARKLEYVIRAESEEKE